MYSTAPERFLLPFSVSQITWVLSQPLVGVATPPPLQVWDGIASLSAPGRIGTIGRSNASSRWPPLHGGVRAPPTIRKNAYATGYLYLPSTHSTRNKNHIMDVGFLYKWGSLALFFLDIASIKSSRTTPQTVSAPARQC